MQRHYRVKTKVRNRWLWYAVKRNESWEINSNLIKQCGKKKYSKIGKWKIKN